jgi:carboxyl-terminal processing protease
MKKIYIVLTAVVLTALTFTACEDQDDKDVPVYDFVWKGLNTYYLWKDNVPALSDDKFATQADLNSYVQNYSSPESLFESLLYNPGVVDRWSVIFPDYQALENALQGISTSNGVEFGLRYTDATETSVFGYVRYILPGTDAATKDIQRGDIFYAVNGTPLTDDNYQSLLSGTTYTLNLATYNAGIITPTNESVTLTKVQYGENPVYFHQAYTQNGHTFGYLMYNGFYSAYENQLNAAFGDLKAQNVTDLVLDLRYNSGGSVRTASYLASMITGQFTGQLFARQQWNSRLQSYYESNNPGALQDLFASRLSNGTSINHLNLNRVFILTTKATASASELVINCLKPYIDVVVIGEKTTGKNVGSITLYDSKDFSKDDTKSNYAMQPIVLKTVNKSGFGDYSAGINPSGQAYVLPEDMGNMGVIGNTSEPLFARAIAAITNTGRSALHQPDVVFKEFRDSKNMRKFGSEMYRDDIPEGMAGIMPLQ